MGNISIYAVKRFCYYEKGRYIRVEENVPSGIGFDNHEL